MIAQLGETYREDPIAVGVTLSGGLLEVLSTVDGKTWTIILTSPQGISCIVQGGVGWRWYGQKKDRGPVL